MIAPPPVLQGEKTRLRPLREDDLPRLVRWFNTPEVRHWLHHSERPDATAEAVTERFITNSDAAANVHWIIETLDGRLVGTTELRLTLRADRAEMGIAIHDKAQWSEGLGTDAVRLVVDYAFEELNLNRVELTTDEDNVRALRCYEKVGFVREGLLRQHRLLDGRFGNTVVMGILRDEWEPLERGDAE